TPSACQICLHAKSGSDPHLPKHCLPMQATSNCVVQNCSGAPRTMVRWMPPRSGCLTATTRNWRKYFKSKLAETTGGPLILTSDARGSHAWLAMPERGLHQPQSLILRYCRPPRFLSEGGGSERLSIAWPSSTRKI